MKRDDDRRGRRKSADVPLADRPAPEDPVLEASEQSFPASDPPAWTSLEIGPPASRARDEGAERR